MCTPATTLHASRCLAANRLAILKKKKKKQTRRCSNAPKQEEEEEEERASRDRLDPM